VAVDDLSIKLPLFFVLEDGEQVFKQGSHGLEFVGSWVQRSGIDW
jgi:hypothetical protein